MTGGGGFTQWDKRAACAGVSLRSQTCCTPGSCWGRRSLTSAPAEADSCWGENQFLPIVLSDLFSDLCSTYSPSPTPSAELRLLPCPFYLLLKGGCSSTPEQLHEASENPVAHPPPAHSFDLLLQENWKNFKIKKKKVSKLNLETYFSKQKIQVTGGSKRQRWAHRGKIWQNTSILVSEHHFLLSAELFPVKVCPDRDGSQEKK